MTAAAATAFTAAADEFVIQLAQERGLLRAAQLDAARALLPAEPGASGAPRLLDVLIRQGALSSRGVAEEAPGAYKDVTEVVEAADRAGLSRKVARLEPLVCVKG